MTLFLFWFSFKFSILISCYNWLLNFASDSGLDYDSGTDSNSKSDHHYDYGSNHDSDYGFEFLVSNHFVFMVLIVTQILFYFICYL